MYDHNQTVVPDSFLALHSAHGRPLLSREEMERRHELCEDMALHAAALLATHVQDAADSGAALQRCHDGLRAEPSSFSAAEAAWVVRRVAELQEWPQPAWLDAGMPAAST
ncbi:MAG: hypothetical protein M3Z16_11485 [Pseudomonadota bacterium]|nr:hypothetical protein [Pseudomonadota bacterium]